MKTILDYAQEHYDQRKLEEAEVQEERQRSATNITQQHFAEFLRNAGLANDEAKAIYDRASFNGNTVKVDGVSMVRDGNRVWNLSYTCSKCNEPYLVRYSSFYNLEGIIRAQEDEAAYRESYHTCPRNEDTPEPAKSTAEQLLELFSQYIQEIANRGP